MNKEPESVIEERTRDKRISRRALMVGGALGAAGIAAAYAMRRSLMARLSRWTRLTSFDSTPPLIAHDPRQDRTRLVVSRGRSPADNVDAVLESLGGIEAVVGTDDVVLIKVAAQWWNQGMTNVAAVKRAIEQILARDGFRGEVIVFENVHFRLANGSGLCRGWTHPSERNVDVAGWTKLADLIEHFGSPDTPVSFVGLVDGGLSLLSGGGWRDPEHAHGTYGGDGRGPVPPGEFRDGYRWDFDQAFRLKRSLVDYAQTPLTWPVFSSPHSGLVVDFKDGLFQQQGARFVPVDRPVTWINMTTANEHMDTGFTGACKSAMGVVDMSAGWMGSDPRVQGYQSVHYFGFEHAMWRMAGPLADFAQRVRRPDLYLTVAEWVGVAPPHGWSDADDVRLEASSAVRRKTVVAGTDPVAIDSWCIRNLLMPVGGAHHERYDLDVESSCASKFLRYYRQVAGKGTLDPQLVDVIEA
jgi:hypothetical protein